ncbi:tumor protein p53-inducible nuclear protein 2 [Exaiptasia diaphana]|uniref:Tumor protein p53-inducible nuclear protein 2 n=1 Tax=Exaiptasia diaphana TaxID=2652724 RepID=A0A913Y5P5_EXADI|nr:tumor protein p53-inducible nuclear protein 2 [Exaiptasia diaphana]KXJ22124.1 Tumor protein p53-inducible nuclear protein 2 [Exaiptasia diaphana]
MFSSLSSYIWGATEDQVVPECPLEVDEQKVDEGWILVDLASVDNAKDQIQREKDAIAVPDSVEESWYVTPPSCFDAGDVADEGLEANPFEDLLIEHPSMSVYGPHRNRSSSASGSSSRPSSQQPNETQAVERRSTRRNVRFQEQLDLISKRKLVEPPKNASRKINTKNLKRQNNVHHHPSRSRRTKKRDRMDGKHVGLHGKRGY